MVSCKLQHQFGNQLTILATTIAHAKKMKTDYLIPTKTITNHPTHKYKNVNYGNIDLPIYRDNERAFTPIPMRDNICLYGFFQDTNYFMDYWDEIVDALALDWKMNEGVVSIHQRRTDYLKNQKAFPPVSLNYVRNGIEHFKALGYNDFKVYSDEISWCRENITSEKFGVNITYSEGNSAIDDLVSQSECEHQIIANSTFSAWAAYLNRNPNKIVIRPPFFLGKKFQHLHKNIYLPEWMVMSND